MKRFIFVFALAAVLIAAFQYLFGWNDFFCRLEELVKETGNPWVFLAVMGIGCAFGLPLSFAYLYGGMAFGVFGGWVLSLGGLLASGSIGYMLGRYVLDRATAEKFRSKVKLDSKKRLYRLNFYVRAVPGIPYWTQNIILGSVHTGFKTYTLSNICVQGAIALAMNYLGANVVAEGAGKYWAFAVLIVVLAAVNKLLEKYCAQ